MAYLYMIWLWIADGGGGTVTSIFDSEATPLCVERAHTHTLKTFNSPSNKNGAIIEFGNARILYAK